MLARSRRISRLISILRRSQTTASSEENIIQEKLRQIHPLWLRERCVGEASVDLETKQPSGIFSNLPKDLAVHEFQVREKEVDVTFSDGHLSTYLIEDILWDAQQFSMGLGGIQSPNYVVPEAVPWGQRYMWRYDDLMKEDGRLLHFCEELLMYGMCLVSGIPPPVEGKRETIANLADVIGPVRKTGWGECFKVRALPDESRKDLAYTGAAIPPHTDNPYRDFAPGYQWLHCVKNECSGGLNYFVDGFHCAEQLREKNPEYFDVLTKVKVRFENFDGHKNRSVSMAPILSVNENGKLTQVRYSDKSGGYAPPLDKKTLELFYQAKHALCEQINKPENRSWLRLKDGQAVVIDNFRILHARTSFDPSEGERYYIGCYTDRDGLSSKYLHLRHLY